MTSLSVPPGRCVIHEPVTQNNSIWHSLYSPGMRLAACTLSVSHATGHEHRLTKFTIMFCSVFLIGSVLVRRGASESPTPKDIRPSRVIPLCHEELHLGVQTVSECAGGKFLASTVPRGGGRVTMAAHRRNSVTVGHDSMYGEFLSAQIDTSVSWEGVSVATSPVTF